MAPSEYLGANSPWCNSPGMRALGALLVDLQRGARGAGLGGGHQREVVQLRVGRDVRAAHVAQHGQRVLHPPRLRPPLTAAAPLKPLTQQGDQMFWGVLNCCWSVLAWCLEMTKCALCWRSHSAPAVLRGAVGTPCKLLVGLDALHMLGVDVGPPC